MVENPDQQDESFRLNRKEFIYALSALGVGVAAYSPVFQFGQKMNWLPQTAFLYSYGSYGAGRY